MNNKNNLLKNIASLGLVQIANYVFPLISIPIISRIIGPDKFGVINYTFAFISYFNLLIGFGFDLSATRRIAKDPKNIVLRRQVFSEVFWAQSFLFILSLIVFVFCLYSVPSLAFEKKVTIFSFLFCVSIVFTQNWLFQAMQDLSKIAILNFISKVLFTFFVLILIKHKEDYYLQPLLLSLIQILIAFISFLWAYRKYNLKLLYVPFHSVLKLLKSERTIFFSMVVIGLYTTTNTVILGLLQNSLQVGYYTAGQRLMDVANNVLNLPLSMALYPFIGFAFSESKEEGVLMVQKILPLIILLTSTVTVILFLLGPYLLHFFYGDAFAPSIPVFRIIIFVPMIIALSNVFGLQIMLNLKMDKLFFNITAIGAVIGIVFNLITVKLFGYIGTAFNWLLVEIYITITMYVFLRIKGINPIDWKQFHPLALKNQIKPVTNKFLKPNQ